jgi:cellulose synthase/poly-beta-1,6-N-acetylglucosamine synthase-like glycosyltransferase
MPTMLWPIDAFIYGVYVVAVVGLFLYGVNAYVMVALHWWKRRRSPTATLPKVPAVWPLVTIQLPLYNERYVVRRLLDAVGELDYPADRLEIQVLDDSTDDTPQLLAAALPRLRHKGFHVVYLHRRERTGFKAGALAAGLEQARGEFIAIFDADFVPPPAFLRQTIPYFADPRVAVVQTRWGHLNREYSLLTRAQALAIDGHFGVEQAARCWGNLFLNFNGSAGVWRAAAIHDAGGWAADTLTEDLDLSYRAQLRGWRILYRPELVCPAELPVLITAFKSQQRRWAKGSIQTAIKLLPIVLRARLPRWTKYQACIHLTYYLIYPLMLTVLLLLVPLFSLHALPPPTAAVEGLGLAFGLATFGPGSLLVYAQRALDAAEWRRAWGLAALMVIGIGISWSMCAAVVSAFWGGDGEFERTPKFGIGAQGGTWRGKGYAARWPWGGVIEIGLGLYCAWTIWLVWDSGQDGALPFLLLCLIGFLAVGMLTVLHASPGGSKPALDRR